MVKTENMKCMNHGCMMERKAGVISILRDTDTSVTMGNIEIMEAGSLAKRLEETPNGNRVRGKHRKKMGRCSEENIGKVQRIRIRGA